MATTRKARKARPLRKRTAETVVRTHLAIITSPESHEGGVSVRADVELAKAAVLYADTVEILSLSQRALQDVHDFSRGSDDSIWTLLSSLDNETLQHLGDGRTDPEQLRAGIAMLRGMNPGALRAAAAGTPELAELANIADVVQQQHDQAADSMSELREISDRLRAESGAQELDVAFQSGQLRYNSRVPLGGDTGSVVAAFLKEVKRYLEDPLKFVLLDQQIASLVRSMIDEGFVNMPARSTANAGEVLLGTGFLTKLPTFPAAPMDQVLELKAGLEEPLGRYRRKVTQLRTHLLTGPFDANVGAEVHGIWRSEVDPAVAEIRQAMADHGLARKFLREASVDIADFVKGVVPRGGLAVLAADVLDLNSVVTVGLTTAAAAAPSAARAVIARNKGRADARANDLYYLHAVDRQLQP